MDKDLEITDGKTHFFISQNTSTRISALRFLLAMLVVFIHNNLTADEALNYYHLDFSEPLLITYFKMFVCNMLGSGAVPLFYLFAGYLQFCKHDSYSVLLKKKMKSLFVPYVIWTLIGILAFFIAQSIPFTSHFFKNENNIVSNWSFWDWINLFWVHDEGRPLVYQLYFVRNLMILVLMSPLLHILAKSFSFFVIVAIFLCYINEIPLGLGTALFFYMCGWFFAEYNVDFFKLSDKISWLEVIALFMFEIIIPIVFENAKTNYIVPIISCFFFLKLSGTIISKEKLFSITNYLAGYSFFVYAIHAPFLVNFLNKLSFRIIPLHGLGCLVQFIFPPFLTILLGTAIGIGFKKICLPVFVLLNGGRK